MRADRATFALAIAAALAVCGAGGTAPSGAAPGGRSVADPVSPSEHAIWEQRDAPSTPGDVTLFYDAAHAHVRGYAVAASVLFEWTGDAWTQSPVLPYPGLNALERVFDAGRARLLVFEGGPDPTLPVHVWEWDGFGWSEGPLAPPLTHRSLVYDEARREIVLFGSRYDGGYGETWTFGAGVWARRAAAGAIPLGGGRSMTYDAHRGVTLLVGEDDCSPTCTPKASSALWEWNGVGWAHPLPSAAPPPLPDGALAYDSARGRSVLFRTADTWEWDGATWFEQRPLGGPRGIATVTFDAARGRVVAISSVFPTTWLYWTFAGRCTKSDGCDTQRCDEGICCSIACGACSRCDATGSACTPVRGAEDPDSCSGDTTCDPGARCRAKGGKPCAHATDCASGECAAGVCCRSACAPYGCAGDGSCRTSCATSGECAAPAVCRGRACMVPDTTCGSAHVSTSNTGVARDCTPFACDPTAGACYSACATSDDCAAGFLCDAAGACKSPPVQPSACALVGGAGELAPSGGGAAALGLTVLAWARARRRLLRARASRVDTSTTFT